MLSELTQKRAVFFELMKLLKSEHMLQDDIISMGNLALLVDYASPRFKWEEKRRQIERFAKLGDKNEVNILIANHVYEIARNLDISDNLDFKLEKMTLAYKENKLMYFDMVLDPYDFPEWFKWIMEYYPSLHKEAVYTKLLKHVERYPELLRKENDIALRYFVEKLYPEQNYLQKITEIDLMLRLSERNDMCWYITKEVFRYYYPETKHDSGEQAFALKRLGEYQQLHNRNDLFYFYLFSKKKMESNALVYEW